MTITLRVFVLLSSLLCSAIATHATPYLTSNVQDLGSGRWQYGYTVTNDLSDSVIKEFTIYFNPELYRALDVVMPGVSGWFQQVEEPVPFTTATVPQDGFFSAISGTGKEIGPLALLGGFSVSFEWIGFDTPLENDPQGFDYILAPYVELPPETVPEPGTLLLLGTGLAGFAGLRKIRAKLKRETSV